MTQPRRRFAAILTALSTVTATIGLLLAGAPTANAAISTGHGVGHLAADGVSWLGSYRLDDGSLVFCLEAGKSAPTGHDYTFVDAASLGRFSPDDLARLAYISRTSAASTDATDAASGQLATWSIAGLNGRDREYYAARAGLSAQAVLSRSQQLLSAASGTFGASRSVSAAVQLSPVDDSGQLRVNSSITVDFLASGPTVLPTGAHKGTLTLTGAVFDDGTTRRTVSNDEPLTITASGDESTVEVAASVSYEALPYGSAFTAGRAGDDVQQVLVARPGSASGMASTTATLPSPKSFQPVVSTTTSASIAAPGALISDELVVSASADTAGGTVLPEWGVYRPSTPPAEGPFRALDENGMLPIPVVVESSLLGPFTDPIEPAAQAPVGAPVVCTVEVRIETGPGTYRTPECALPGPGYFVWVERIVPDRIPAEQGGTRILPWQSAFGTASEVTFVDAPPPPAEPVAVAAPRVLADTGSANTASLVGLSASTLFAGALAIVGVLCLRRFAAGRHTLSAR